jgi:hypothetical protein
MNVQELDEMVARKVKLCGKRDSVCRESRVARHGFAVWILKLDLL